MTADTALGLLKDMLWTAVLVSGPVIIVSMVVGLVFSIVQVVTQIQEMTLTFVPKLVAIFMVLVIGGGWMLSVLVHYSQKLYANIPSLVH